MPSCVHTHVVCYLIVLLCKAAFARCSCRCLNRIRALTARLPRRHAVAAFTAAAASLQLYPDGSATELREAIAARYGLKPDRIVCGAGSDELLQLLAHAYLGPGDEAIHSQFGFLVYPIAIMANGAAAVVAPERDYTASVDEILKLVTAKTRAPRILQNWIAAAATPPLAPSTRTSSPLCTLARLTIARQAVWYASGAAAALIKSNPSGMRMSLSALAAKT